LTERPNADAIRDAAALRDLAWFSHRYAVTVLPSVSALKELRRSAPSSKASKPFLGVGDPLLKHHPPAGERVTSRFGAPGALVRGVFRGGEVDVEYLRSLPSLPETAGELEAEAEMLRATPDSLFLRERATVTAVTHADLVNRRIITFATHALLGGDSDFAEPGLVLTPPTVPSPEDDGLLRASAIAMLKLDADLVVLSACNTAASDGTPGAEGFSGLTKAFLYSGTRALVVSHWSVESEATVALMRHMFAAAGDRGVGRAEALRDAMMAVMEDQDHPEFAHPFYWAPFVVVGEGGLPAFQGGGDPPVGSR
jgi:CHAT domain-containing protein